MGCSMVEITDLSLDSRTLASLHATRTRALLDASEPARQQAHIPHLEHLFQPSDPALAASFFPSSIPFFPSAAVTPMATPPSELGSHLANGLQAQHASTIQQQHQHQQHDQRLHHQQQQQQISQLPHDLVSTDDLFNVFRMQPVPPVNPTQFGLPGEKDWTMSDENWGTSEPGQT